MQNGTVKWMYTFISRKNIVRDMISTTVLKVNICEKYKISSTLLISRIQIFENTLILWINATWMNMRALKNLSTNYK